MSLAITDIAALSASLTLAGHRPRVSNPDARALAERTVKNTRAAVLADAERAAETRRGYGSCSVFSHGEKALCDRCETGRQNVLRRVVWPRSSAVRAAVHAADAAAREAHMKHDADALYAAVLRAHRLSVLSVALDRRARSVGAFGVSFTDMHVGTSRFLVKAAWRRFMFAGGRDRVSSAFTDEDVLQGAFLRAIDAGDTVNGVPMWGALFRHVQAERAHLTRTAGAEWRGIQDALHGARPTERAYADADDKHVLRRLGTRDAFGRPFGTVETHRAALAIAHREAERENIGATVTHEARSVAILAGDEASFPRILADVLMRGATLADVADALGLTIQTVKDKALTERVAYMASGVDHSEDVPEYVAERERAVLHAQSAHADALRARYALAQRADYLRNHGARRAVILTRTA